MLEPIIAMVDAGDHRHLRLIRRDVTNLTEDVLRYVAGRRWIQDDRNVMPMRIRQLVLRMNEEFSDRATGSNE
ncbi:hypothetical protein [Paenibacillus terrigena]|uniref:hypothetical protein n=1 Tax=Paenibacillus terrigena TaxID=369333 RepID=UPI0028D42EC0|nr:hypothetical protein [Paenibacillus terrigena]